MSKKRRRGGVVVTVVGPRGGIPPGAVAALAEGLARDQEGFVWARSVECSVACCPDNRRDGLIVAVPHERLATGGLVAVVAADAHGGQTTMALVGVEDLKRFVNLCGEAIARVEAAT